jgi:hypothetical protein
MKQHKDAVAYETPARSPYETPTIQTYSEAFLKEQFGEVAALSTHDDTYSDIAK